MNIKYESKESFKIIIALFFGFIISYLINVYSTYSKYKGYNESYVLNKDLFVNIAVDMFSYVGHNLETFKSFPILFFIPLIYIYIFIRTLIAKDGFLKNYRTINLTILVIIFYVFNYRFVGFVASIY